MCSEQMRASGLPRYVLALVAACNSVDVFALDYAVRAGYRGEYTNNVRQSSVDEESDVIHRPQIDLALLHDSPELALGMDYQIQRRIYQDEAFDDETLLQGSANALWAVLPRRLELYGTHQRSETRIRTRDEATPTNLQESEESAAGATLILPSFSNHALRLGYEYSATGFEQTRNDSKRQKANATYVMPFSSTDTLSLSGLFERVNFDEPFAPDYDSATGSFAYERDTVQMSTRLSIGYQSIDRELDRDTVEGIVGEVSLLRRFPGGSAIGVMYSQDFRDNSINQATFLFDNAGDANAADGFVGDTDINEVYEEKRLALTYDTPFGVNSLGIVLEGTRQEYEEANERDVETWGARVQIGRSIRSTLDGHLSAEYRYSEYPLSREENEEAQADIGLAWRWSPRLNVGLDIYYLWRVQRRTIESEVEDWGAGITLSYLLFGSDVGKNSLRGR